MPKVIKIKDFNHLLTWQPGKLPISKLQVFRQSNTPCALPSAPCANASNFIAASKLRFSSEDGPLPDSHFLIPLSEFRIPTSHF
jgi:hypothetical protein